MPILKLPNEGDTYTGHVTKCEVVAGQYGEQVCFDFANTDRLFLPKDSADRQLVRLAFGDGTGVHYAEVVGHTLAFSRDHNPKVGSKPYWGIALCAPGDVKPQPPSKRLPSPGSAGNPHTEDKFGGKGIVPGHPDDAPPVDDADAPPAEDYPEKGSGQPTYAGTPATGRSGGNAGQPSTGGGPREVAYYELARRVAAFQAEMGKEHECPFDLASINAMTFSIMGGIR